MRSDMSFDRRSDMSFDRRSDMHTRNQMQTTEFGFIRQAIRQVRRTVVYFLAVATAMLALGGCLSFNIDTPDRFRRFHDTDDLKMITADGVMLKSRTIENYPKADLSFWVDAMKRHLEERGYAFKHEDCFQTQTGLDGCAIEFILPHGAEDWVFSQCLFVIDDAIVVLESAGPFEKFVQVEESLRAAYRTFHFDS